MRISLTGSEEIESAFISADSAIVVSLQSMIVKMDEIRKIYIKELCYKCNKYFKLIEAMEDNEIRKHLIRQMLDQLELMPVNG